MNRSLFNFVSGVLAVGAVLFPASSDAYSVESSLADFSESALEVCRNESGSLRSGDLDVIILLDNSKSLWESDKSGVRFEAIDGFVDSFQQIADRAKNLSLIKFGASAEVVVPFAKITTPDDARRIKDTLRRLVPNDYQTQESFTNYVAALERAREEFLSNDSSNRNCRVLIWFTDGVFDTNDSRQPDEVQRDVRRLEDQVCRSGGLGEEYSKSDINTFVVYLTPQNPDPDRSRISQDAMQVVTGDRQPSFSGQDSSPRAPSSGCVIGSRHLGEVISVEDTNSLIGYLIDIVPAADGGKPIFPEECPVQVVELSTLPLIDGHLVEWISVTSWAESLDDRAFTIDLADGSSQSLTNLFEAEVKGNKLSYYRPTSGARELLDAGWRLSLKNAGEVCVRLKPINPKFEIGRDNVTKSLDGLPEELFVGGRLKLFVDKEPADVATAMKNPGGLTAELEVVSGAFLASPNRLPAEVTVDGAFQINPPNCVIEVDKEGDVPNSPIESSSCVVTPARSEDTSYDASKLIASLDECGLGAWQLRVDGMPSELSGAIRADSSPVELSVATVNNAVNKDASCEQSLRAAITISTKQASSQIGAEVEIELRKRGNILLAIVFAVLMTIVVAFLSLLLLKGINMMTAKTVDGNSLFAYETEAEIEPGTSERGTLRWTDSGQKTKSYKANPDLLEPVTTDPKRTSLKAGELRFERRIPSLFRPFAESRLKMVTPTPAAFWQPNHERDGLPLTFAKAIVISRIGREDLSLRSNIKVRVTVLVPRRGSGSGFGGAEDLIRDKADDLAADLWEASSVAAEGLSQRNNADPSTSIANNTAEIRSGDPAPPIKPPPVEAPKPPTTSPPRSLPNEPPKFPR